MLTYIFKQTHPYRKIQNKKQKLLDLNILNTFTQCELRGRNYIAVARDIIMHIYACIGRYIKRRSHYTINSTANHPPNKPCLSEIIRSVLQVLACIESI